MSRATLLTGDLDFKPLIDAVVQEGMFITLWYPPGETNEELIRSADGRQRLDLRSIHTILCDECQASINLPSTRIENYYRESGIFLGEIDGAYGLIKIRKELKEFVVYIPIQNKLGKFIVSSHSDWNLLRFFFGDCFDAVIPECPPSHGDL